MKEVTVNGESYEIYNDVADEIDDLRLVNEECRDIMAFACSEFNRNGSVSGLTIGAMELKMQRWWSK